LVFRLSISCSVSLIVLAVLAMVMTGSAMFAQELEPTTCSKVNIYDDFRARESHAIRFFMNLGEGRKAGKYRYHNFSGWIYVNNQDSKGQEVYIQLKKPDGIFEHYLTVPMERPDVGTGFSNPIYNHSGFSASIPLKDGLDIDACKIRLVVKNKNGIFKSPEWKSWGRVNPSSERLKIFVAINWLLAVLTAIVLLVSIWRDRSLLIKPSIMAILFFHVMCQWAFVTMGFNNGLKPIVFF